MCKNGLCGYFCSLSKHMYMLNFLIFFYLVGIEELQTAVQQANDRLQMVRDTR